MKKYPKYKDSGIEWIGEIPEHWEVKRIKLLSPVKRGASPRPIADPIYFDDKGEYAWVRIADVSASERYLVKTTQTLSELGASLSVKRNPGDFFLSIAGTVGKPMITKIKCCIHDGFVWFPDLKISAEFLYYIFETGLPYQGLGKLGTQLNLNTETIGNITVPIPSNIEMENLIVYLDRKTAEIDALIEKKQQLIELYKEERTATINAAVTGKLDVNNLSASGCAGWKDEQDAKNPENQVNPKNPAAHRKMKHSGIEWLGDIPEHWEVKKIKHLTSKVGSGVTPKGGAETYLESGIPLLRSQNVYNDGFRLEDVAYISDEVHQGMSGSKVFKNDVLLNITGGSIGRSFYVKNQFDEANVNQHVCILRPNKNVLPEYLHSFLISEIGQLQIEFCQLGGNREAVNFEQIKNFYIPTPSFDEQNKLITVLNKLIEEATNHITKAEQEIELLKEYKTALISEVVLGKVDVRGGNCEHQDL